MGEKGKIAIRNIRREANEDLKKKLKEKILSEDQSKNFEKIFKNLQTRILKILKKSYQIRKKIIQI